MEEKKLNLINIFKLLFDDNERTKYQFLSNEEKTKWGFIVNRYLSKKFPEMSQHLNVRGGDLSIVLDLWWIYLKFQDRNKWDFWIWKTGDIKGNKISPKILRYFQGSYPQLTEYDIEYLSKWFPEEFDEEVKHYEKIEEDYGNR